LSKDFRKIRDVVYGFVEIDAQECQIIDHPYFQRLRRIKQLSLTDMVYPGATHTRFEHSIGVMQMATDMFDCIVKKRKNFLEQEYSLEDAGIKKYRKMVRLAALLHDIGHAPFSHSGEDLMPLLPNSHPRYTSGQEKRYQHEEYSIEIIKKFFKTTIEEHPLNVNYSIKVEEVTALLDDTSFKPIALSLLWKELISGQLDADRADYLLRDSLHLGVNYGLYDRNRLVSCMTVGKRDTGALGIAIEEKGLHIAESLVIARYQMFSQVYFHKTRRIYDYHIHHAVKSVLRNQDKDSYPSPNCIEEYLSFDDWAIYSALKQGQGGKHGEIILNRQHFKRIFETEFVPTPRDEQKLQELVQKYSDSEFCLDDKASTTWYKANKDILVYNGDCLQPLSLKSEIVRSMESQRYEQKRFYAKK